MIHLIPSTLIGWVWLGEQPTLWVLAGGVVILSAMMLVILSAMVLVIRKGVVPDGLHDLRPARRRRLTA